MYVCVCVCVCVCVPSSPPLTKNRRGQVPPSPAFIYNTSPLSLWFSRPHRLYSSPFSSSTHSFFPSPCLSVPKYIYIYKLRVERACISLPSSPSSSPLRKSIYTDTQRDRERARERKRHAVRVGCVFVVRTSYHVLLLLTLVRQFTPCFEFPPARSQRHRYPCFFFTPVPCLVPPTLPVSFFPQSYNVCQCIDFPSSVDLARFYLTFPKSAMRRKRK